MRKVVSPRKDKGKTERLKIEYREFFWTTTNDYIDDFDDKKKP